MKVILSKGSKAMNEHDKRINNPTVEAVETRERGKRWLTELQRKVQNRRTEEAARTAAEDAELAAAEAEFGRALAEDQLKARVAAATEQFNADQARHDEVRKAATEARTEYDGLVAKMADAYVTAVTAELARAESEEQLRGQWMNGIRPLGIPIGEPAIEPKRLVGAADQVATAARELAVALRPDAAQVVQQLLRHSSKRKTTYWIGGREVTEYR
jgi:hypothetical protein